MTKTADRDRKRLQRSSVSRETYLQQAEHRRAEIAILRADGMTNAAIAKKLACSEQEIYRLRRTIPNELSALTNGLSTSILTGCPPKPNELSVPVVVESAAPEKIIENSVGARLLLRRAYARPEVVRPAPPPSDVVEMAARKTIGNPHRLAAFLRAQAAGEP